MTENVTQNTFGDRLVALTEAIAARPDAPAEDHLTYAEFLLSGERSLEAIVGEVEGDTNDPRVQAWYRVADHPLLLEAFDYKGSLIDGVIRRLDELHEREKATEKIVSSTPAYLDGRYVQADEDHLYPDGVIARDEDGDDWRKEDGGWQYRIVGNRKWHEGSVKGAENNRAVIVA